MDEWIDDEEKAQRLHHAACEKFLATLERDIREAGGFFAMDMLFCALNAGLGLRNLIMAWTLDHLGYGIFAGSFSGIAAMVLGWMGLRYRRRFHYLRTLRKSMLGAMQAKTRIQLEHYVGQGDAAMRNLLADR
jgi:hypothetical protein